VKLKESALPIFGCERRLELCEFGDKVDVLELITYPDWVHLYLSGMWLGVAPRTDTKKMCV
jgi:hypothetical protein